MKLFDIITEEVSIPFENRCTMVITNSKGEEIKVDCEVPTTEEEKALGLMNRDSLGDNNGMYYDYVDGGFWMKDVSIPLEMIFSKDGKIVEIVKAKPYDESNISPSVEADSNLEVNDGFSEKNNIRVGDSIYRS
jgi:uncharacterized membrane protein (UPF0127 family)